MAKICIVGDFSKNQDEGLKNIAYNITRNLSRERNELLKADINQIFRLHFWKTLKQFKPDIIHYINGRTLQGFILLKILGIFTNAITIMSAFHPDIFSVSNKSIQIFKPDLILIQDKKNETKFKQVKCQTELLPNGVDTEKFKPASDDEKKKLRAKYGINNKYVVLHVGHIIKDRNLQIFYKLQNKENQGLIIGSTFRESDNHMLEGLINKGCIVKKGFFKNIEEIYALSDCYIFPVLEKKSISTPLSVLEAMSCNLPVITTKFDGLVNFFHEGNGLIYADNDKEIIKSIEKLKKQNKMIKTRDKILPFSWNIVTDRLEEIYDEII